MLSKCKANYYMPTLRCAQNASYKDAVSLVVIEQLNSLDMIKNLGKDIARDQLPQLFRFSLEMKQGCTGHAILFFQVTYSCIP